MNAHFDVIVVGGGLAGLVAGATAALDGASAVVLEAHRPGGRARVSERDGFVFNNGVHALFAGGPGTGVLDALGIRPTGAAPPMDRYMLLADGVQHVLPVGPDAAAQSTYLDAADKVQLGEVFGRMAGVQPEQLVGLSVSDWIAGAQLRPRVDALIRALFRLSTYVADLDQLGADAGVAQQQTAARAGVRYLHGGWAQLVAALQSKVEVRSGTTVHGVSGDATSAAVHTADGTLTAGAVVIAAGTPRAARALLPGDPGWGDLGEPVTAACLDAGVRRVPSPGYVVAVDDPLYGTIQSPPARQAPAGYAVAGVIRYGARDAQRDRPQLEAHLRQLGVTDDDVMVRRFLARMVVSGAMPRAITGGLVGRPSVAATGMPRVFVAGDWVGPQGMLADAAIASGHAAGRAALRARSVLPAARR